MKSMILAACLSIALLVAALAYRGTSLHSQPQADHEDQSTQSFGSAYDVGNWKRKLDSIDRERRDREGRVLQAFDPALAERTGQAR
jgi:hypothetical protein